MTFSQVVVHVTIKLPGIYVAVMDVVSAPGQMQWRANACSWRLLAVCCVAARDRALCCTVTVTREPPCISDAVTDGILAPDLHQQAGGHIGAAGNPCLDAEGLPRGQQLRPVGCLPEQAVHFIPTRPPGVQVASAEQSQDSAIDACQGYIARSNV